MRIKPDILLTCLAILAFACQQEKTTNKESTTPQIIKTAREKYEEGLTTTGLDSTQIGMRWFAIAKAALNDSLLVNTPFQEKGYFRAEYPNAHSFRFELKRGHVVKVLLKKEPRDIKLFGELYREVGESRKNYFFITTLDTVKQQFNYEATVDGVYILRLQPELLANCKYDLSIQVGPAMAFPVERGRNPDIGSFFGDPRDGGRRKHKGIDIFAKKGTPTLAIVDGWVNRVKEGGLGGKVVWLRDKERQYNLYYAHLDTQLVYEGQQVKVGDTLGLVGNTGNARRTPPHLHFGIYVRQEGAIDPLHYVYRLRQSLPTINVDTSLLGNLARSKNQTLLKTFPGRKGKQIQKIDRHAIVQVIGALNSAYHVQLLDGTKGYVRSTALQSLDKPIKVAKQERTEELFARPDSAATSIALIPEGTTVKVLARQDTYRFVESENGEQGWLK